MPSLKHTHQERLAPNADPRPRQEWSPYQGDIEARRQVQAWQAHIVAGRIGAHLCSNASLLENDPPCPPEVAARREANEGVLKRALNGSRTF